MAEKLKDVVLGVSHPYYPVDLQLPGYVAPQLPFTTVLAVFFSASIILALASWTLSGRVDCYAACKPNAQHEMIVLQADTATCRPLIVLSFLGLP